MVEHSASVTIKAPIHQVYMLFTHFNDFPKFMSFIQEVTYYDNRRSHWVAQVIKPYEWDAVNEDWIEDQQIGWRSTRGLHNSGKVKFRAISPTQTIVDVYLRYTPPSGPLGALGERLGVSSRFDEILQKDLHNFAQMVEHAPPGSLDPMSSHYLFHTESATVKGQVTNRQKVAMAHDPMMSPQALNQRKAKIAEEAERKRQAELAKAETLKQKAEHDRQLRQEQQAIVAREQAQRRKEERERALQKQETDKTPLDPRYTYAAWARGLGDKDGLRARVPNYGTLSMSARRPPKIQASAKPPGNE